MFLSLFGNQRPPSTGVRSGLLINGILCVIFGLAILAAPDLLAFIVATFLIVVGASLLIAWWKLSNALKGR